MICKNCGNELKQNEKFCTKCGLPVTQETENTVEVKTASGKLSGKKIGIIAAVVLLAVIILAVIISNIHTCDECGDVYFGSKNEISFFGETEDICDDCYNDLFGFGY